MHFCLSIIPSFGEKSLSLHVADVGLSLPPNWVLGVAHDSGLAKLSFFLLAS